MQQLTRAQIGLLTGPLTDDLFFTTDTDQAGLWRHDPLDTTSLANNETILLTADNKRIKRILFDAVNVQWFGARGDGITDDTTAIQQALIFAFEQDKNLVATSATYVVSKTIIIPPNPHFDKNYDIDFGNSYFRMLNDIPLFASGYYQPNGDLVANFYLPFPPVSEPEAAFYSYGITLRNFSIYYKTQGAFTLSATALMIRDYHQGCKLENIASRCTQTILESKNNFYCNFIGIRVSFGTPRQAADPYPPAPTSPPSDPPTVHQEMFIFTGQHNLCKFAHLQAGGAIVGYLFAGPLTACQLTNISFELVQIGAKFISEVYDCVIENSYCEHVKDVVIKCTSYVDSLALRNNYVNFTGIDYANMHFIEYTPLPLNNIIVEQDNVFVNMAATNKIFKNNDNTVGYNNLTVRKAPKVPINASELLADNTLFSSQFFIHQEFNLPKGKANLVNQFAVGNYSGRYTGGFSDYLTYGIWQANGNICSINTRMVHSDTQNIYVNIRIAAGVYVFIKGNFIGDVFYEYTPTGIAVSSALSLSVVGGFLQINSQALAATVTGAEGEIRLI